MAKQNFLSGGYYGKLGVTVGQRWKNIRTIRSYVIPANPRTEKQQANRGQFGGAVQKSQLAMQMNYNATCFEHADFSRWNYRMKTARELQDASVTDLDLLPLYPITFVPPFLITSMEISDVSTPQTIVFSVTGQLPNTDRVLSVLFHLFDDNNVEVGYKLYVGTYSAVNPGFITVQVDNNSEINDNCFVRLVSRDDVDSATDLVASGMLQVQGSSYDERDFNTGILSISKDKDKVTVVFNEPYRATTASSFSGSVYAVSKGAFVTVNGSSLPLVNSGGYFAVEIPCSYTYSQEILAFPTGSSVNITSIVAEGTRFKYTKYSQNVSFSDTDLSRAIEKNFSYDASESANVECTFAFNLDSGFTINNGGIVCSGLFDDKSQKTTSLSVSYAGSEVTRIRPSGVYMTMPMRAGDYLLIPAFNISQNGVTYSMGTAYQFAIINAISSSTALEEIFNPTFYHEGGIDSELIALHMYFDGITLDSGTDLELSVTPSTKVHVIGGGNDDTSYDAEMLLAEQSGSSSADLLFSFSEEVEFTSSALVGIVGGVDTAYFTYKNIEYSIDVTQLPSQLGNYEEW